MNPSFKKHTHTRSFIHSPTHPPSHSPTHSPIHPSIYPFIYPFIYLFIYLLIHSSIHPSIQKPHPSIDSSTHPSNPLINTHPPTDQPARPSTLLSIHPLKAHPSIQKQLFPPTHPSTHPSIHLLIHLFIYSSIHPSIHSFIYPSTHPIPHPSIHPSTHSANHPSNYPSIHPFIHYTVILSWLSCLIVLLLCVHSVWLFQEDAHWKPTWSVLKGEFCEWLCGNRMCCVCGVVCRCGGMGRGQCVWGGGGDSDSVSCHFYSRNQQIIRLSGYCSQRKRETSHIYWHRVILK